MKTTLHAWGPVLVWMAFIFYLSAQSRLPAAPEAWLDILLKKSAHFLVYAVLARLYLRALGFHRRVPGPPAVLALLLAAAYAATDEFHQGLVPGRTPSPTDWLIDCAGAGTGLALRQVAGRRPLIRSRPRGDWT